MYPGADTHSERRTMLRWIVFAAVIAGAAALAGIDARATTGARTTADEPQYLLTALSLAEDADLDIADELADRAYLPFHEVPVDRQTSILDDGREISPHDPGLPVVLALPMVVGGWHAAKVTLALLAAATASVTAWVAIRRFDVHPAISGLTMAVVFAGVPLAPYGTQVYPEMPAALATILAVAALTRPAASRATTAITVASIVALPWLAVKYAPVATVLATALLIRLRHERRHLTIAATTLVAAGVAYLALHQVWYGGWTVYSTGDHFESTGELSVVGTDVDVLGRTRRIAGLIVDREFGIGTWHPIWLLAPLAAATLARRRPAGWLLILATIAAGWANATFVALTMHGWWVPGRQIVVVLPLVGVLLAALIDRRRELVPVATVLGALGAVNWGWLAWETSTGRRTLVVDPMDTAALPYRAVAWIMPSGMRDGRLDAVLLVGWSCLLVASVWYGWRSAGITPAHQPATRGLAPARSDA